MPRIHNWLDVLLWAFFAGVTLFILGTFLQIVWQTVRTWFEPARPSRWRARSRMGGLGGDTPPSTSFDATSDASDSSDAGDGGSDSASDGSGGDFSGGGGDYGGGGGSGGWS